MNKKIPITPLRGYLYALLATAIWSGNLIVARGLSSQISPVSLAFYRWLVACLIFLPFSIGSVIRTRKILVKNIPYLLVTSILGVALFNTLIYIAGHSTSAVNMSIIIIIFPVFMIILAVIFLKEKITIGKLIGILIIFTGALLLISGGRLDNLRNLQLSMGDLWMLIASLIFALYSILLKFRPKGMELIPFQQCTFVIGLLFLLPFFLKEQVQQPPVEFTMPLILSIFYLGIFASLFAFLLWNKAILEIGPVKTGFVYYLLPLLSSLQAFLFLGEEIVLYHYMSLALILMGIFFANIRFGKRVKI